MTTHTHPPGHAGQKRTPPAGLPARSLLPLWRRIHQEFMARTPRWHLPSTVCLALVHLLRHPEDAEPAALAEAIHVPRQTMTFILDSLEKKDLAARQPHRSDRRRKVVELTAAGQELAEAMFQDLLQFEAAGVRAIEEADLAAIQRLLTRYVEALAARNAHDRRA
jgi:DNA-binding MarR family transcriptional regulator